MTATRPKSSDVANRFRCRAGVSLAALLAGLGLSGTPALQAFGLTMLMGTTLSWLLVPMFRIATEKRTN